MSGDDRRQRREDAGAGGGVGGRAASVPPIPAAAAWCARDANWTPFVEALRDLLAWERSEDAGRPAADGVGCLVATFEDGGIDEIPLGDLLRLRGFPATERTALDLCRGRVLDVGAGGGPHALELSRSGLEVTALDGQAGSAAVAQARGLGDARHGSVWDDRWRARGERWDTLLLMMNGLGLCGDLAGLGPLLDRCAELLAPGGLLLADGCDLRLGDDEERRRIELRAREGRGFGESRVSMRYASTWPPRSGDPPVEGETFPWLYVDAGTLRRQAEERGWLCQVVVEEGVDYLARLVRAED